jgi:hypothetical protein
MRGKILILVLAGLVAGGPAWAEKGGKGHGKEHGRGDAGDEDGGRRSGKNDPETAVVFRFGDVERVVVREYYSAPPASGRCPPGLAKKNNGCLPPGQAKKWNIGRPLPRDLVFYDLPRDLVVRLPAPPAGHRYVRVAADILLIAVGSGLVIDAIQDLGRL